jgi:phospholipase/carboxylesterase
VQGVTEENRQQRIDAIMPTFIEIVRYWQRKAASVTGHRADRFLSGAIMSLESIKAAPDLASRVIAFNGRYATLPETATTATTIHLIHGVKIGLSIWRGRCRPGGVAAGGRRRDAGYC